MADNNSSKASSPAKAEEKSPGMKKSGAKQPNPGKREIKTQLGKATSSLNADATTPNQVVNSEASYAEIITNLSRNNGLGFHEMLEQNHVDQRHLAELASLYPTPEDIALMKEKKVQEMKGRLASKVTRR